MSLAYGKAGSWGSDTKRDSRRRSLLQPLRRKFHRHSIPESRTVFSLGGRQVDGGKLIPGTELSELYAAGLLVAGSQYFSVEHDRQIHETNAAYCGEDSLDPLAPAGWDCPHWIHGDFFSRLNEHLAAGYKPAIIYADTMSAYSTFRKQFKTLFHDKRVPRGTILVINCVCKAPYLKAWTHNAYTKQVTRAVEADSRGTWEVIDHFKYHGAIHSWMETVVLRKL